MSAFRAVDERLIHQGAVVAFWNVTFEAPDGSTFDRDVVRHPGAVAVVALEDDGNVVMVRQFRAALLADLLEIPAGKTDVDGEALVVAAQRELAEEVGFEADEWVHLTTYAQSPGFCDEMLHIFLARGLRNVPTDLQGIEEEHMTVERIALADAPALIASGEISDGKTIIGLMLARSHLELGTP